MRELTRPQNSMIVSSESPGRRHIALDRDQLADDLEPGLLDRLAAGDLVVALAVMVDQPGDDLDYPGRKPGEQRRQAELLDQHDRVAIGVVEQDRHRRATADDVIDPLAAPFAGEHPVTEADDIEPQMPLERDVLRR